MGCVLEMVSKLNQASHISSIQKHFRGVERIETVMSYISLIRQLRNPMTSIASVHFPRCELGFGRYTRRLDQTWPHCHVRIDIRDILGFGEQSTAGLAIFQTSENCKDDNKWNSHSDADTEGYFVGGLQTRVSLLSILDSFHRNICRR